MEIHHEQVHAVASPPISAREGIDILVGHAIRLRRGRGGQQLLQPLVPCVIGHGLFTVACRADPEGLHHQLQVVDDQGVHAGGVGNVQAVLALACARRDDGVERGVATPLASRSVWRDKAVRSGCAAWSRALWSSVRQYLIRSFAASA
jgi:hypothetical protein